MNRKERIERLKRIARLKDAMAAQQPEEQIESPEASQQEEGPSAMQAAGMGAMQGATFHMADEIAAGKDTVDAVLKSVADRYNEVGAKGITDALPNIKETYNKSLDRERLLLENARKKHPIAFTTGDIAGSILSTAATFGAGKLMHLGRALSTARGALTANTAISAAHGFGASEDETIVGMLEDSAKAGAIGAAGDVAGQAAGMAFNSIGPAIRNMSTGTLLRYFRVDKGTATNSLKNFGKDVDDWAQRVINYKDIEGKKIIDPFITRQTMAGRIAKERSVQGSEMGAILDEVDNNFKLDVNADAIYDDLVETVIEGKGGLIDTIDVDQEKMAIKLRENLYRTFYKKQKLDPKTGEVLNPREVRDNLTLNNIHKWVSKAYKDASKALRSTDPAIENIYMAKRDIADRMSEHIDDIINTSGQLRGEDLFKRYSDARRNFGDMKEAEKLIIKSLKDDPAEGFLNEVFSNGINKYLIAAGTLGTQGGLAGSEYMIAVGALKGVAENRAFNSLLSKSAKTIADAIEQDPNKFGNIASKLIVSSSVGGKALVEDIMMASAQIDLMKQPIARSTQEVIRRQDSLLTVLDAGNKALAGKLRKAIATGNDAEIAGIMSELSNEDPAGIIEKGLGWEGKAITESDKQAVQDWLKSIPNARKRMMLTSKFEKEQMIPEEMTNPEMDTNPVNKFVKPAAKRSFRGPKDLGY